MSWPGKYPEFWTELIWDAVRAALTAFLGVMSAKAFFTGTDLRVGFAAAFLSSLTSVSVSLKDYPPREAQKSGRHLKKDEPENGQ